MELIRRLHDNGRQWEGEYPTPKEVIMRTGMS